jgi:sterol desaturase/sphingolipid hydroxylase (fatty acid hydroxylase superfamily)
VALAGKDRDYTGMHEWLLEHEAAARFGAFAGVLLALLAAQWRWPRRPLAAPARRWGVNLAMVAIDTVFVRLAVPLGAAGAALWAQNRGVGLLTLAAWPPWLEGALAFLALDCLIYWQHRLFHRIPLFWRLHRMHHSDLEIDTTTGVRFHPVEIAVSMLIKIAAVIALGAPVFAVIVFEIALNATSLFNHANVALPLRLDRALRLALVTPDMHRVHHSVHRREHDSNFGFNLSWWDHVFRSYTDQPADGHLTMRIGLHAFRDAAEQRLGPLLLQPVRPLGPERGGAPA